MKRAKKFAKRFEQEVTKRTVATFKIAVAGIPSGTFKMMCCE